MSELSSSDPGGAGVHPDWFVAIRRVANAVTAGLNVIGTLLIVLIMLLVNFDVIGRTLFNAPCRACRKWCRCPSSPSSFCKSPRPSPKAA